MNSLLSADNLSGTLRVFTATQPTRLLRITYTVAMTHSAALAPKETGIALGLTLLGFVFVAGLQHFYLGKIGRGILWFLTGGLFLVGTIIDLFTISSQVKNINARRAAGIS